MMNKSPETVIQICSWIKQGVKRNLSNAFQSCILYLIFSAVHLVCLETAAYSGTPHSVYGHIEYQNGSFPDVILLEAYITIRTSETLTHNSVGCGYEPSSGKWFIQCANFTTDWTAGEVLKIIFQDNTGLTDSVQVVLSTNPTDDAGTTILQIAVHQITIQTDPTGREFQIDGQTFTSTQTYLWPQGSHHMFSTTSPQGGPIDTQYIFSFWSDGQEQSHTFTVGSTDQTITVFFKTQYFLTVESDYGCPQGQGWYDSSSTAAFSVTTPESGGPGIQYGFKYWTGTGTGAYAGTNPNSTVVMNNPITQTASWEIQYSFSSSVSPANAGIISPLSGWYSDDVTINVEAKADTEAGYIFLEWSGDLTGKSNPSLLLMNGPKDITAHFEIPDDYPPAITDCFPGGGAVEIPVNTSLQLKIFDPFPGYGIDPATLTIYVNTSPILFNGIDQTNGRVIIESYAVNAFHVMYDPHWDFSPSSIVTIRAICQDLTPESKSIDTTYHFSIGTSSIIAANTAVLDEYGGSIVDQATGIRLTVPQGALENSTEIMIGSVDVLPKLPDSVTNIGANYYFAPDGIQFKDSVALFIPFNSTILQDAGITNPIQLPVYYFSTRKGIWEKLKNQRLIGESIYLKVKEFCYLTFGKEDKTDVEILDSREEKPAFFDLLQNYPNPFNSNTIIRYQLPKETFVHITIYDTIGRRVRTLVCTFKQEGYHYTEWDGRDNSNRIVSTGVYFYMIRTGEYSKILKAFYVK
jgi:hypothetical protein